MDPPIDVQMLEQHPRRPRACRNCRARRQACHPTDVNDLSKPCVLCNSVGVPCVIDRDFHVREINEISDLRAQVKRLSRVVDGLSGPPDSVDRAVEVDDLVDRLTRLCFNADGLNGPMSRLNVEDEDTLYRQAHCLFAPTEQTITETDLQDGGFSQTTPRLTHDSIESLLTALPSWAQMQTVLQMWPILWARHTDCLYLPTFPAAIEQMYAQGFSPTPHSHSLAEIFAFLAYFEAAQGVRRATNPNASTQHMKESETYILLAQTALELGAYRDEPTLYALRAVYVMAFVQALCWIDLSHANRGLALIPVAMTILYDLKFNLADDYFDGEAEDFRYERKALATAIARYHWYYLPAFNRASPLPSSTFDCLPPKRAPPCSSPRYSSWQPSGTDLKAIGRRQIIARFRGEMHSELYSSPTRTLDYAKARALAVRLESIEQEVVPPDWRFQEDVRTGLMRLEKPKLVEHDDRIARILTISYLYHTKISFHRLFILLPPTTEVDVKWHRQELTRACNSMLQLMPEAIEMVGDSLSLYCTSYDAMVSCALLISSFPALTPSPVETARCRASIMRFVSRPRVGQQPAAFTRLARLISFLIYPSERDRMASAKRLRTNFVQPSTRLPSKNTEPVEHEFTFSSEDLLPSWPLEDSDLLHTPRTMPLFNAADLARRRASC